MTQPAITVKNSGSSISIAGLLGLVFIVLKLTGTGQVATWSWWWVLSPFWLPLAVVLAILALGALVVGVLHLIDRPRSGPRRTRF